MHRDSAPHDIDTAPFAQLGEFLCPTCGDAFCVLGTCPDDGDELVEAHSDTDRRIGALIDERYRIVRVLGEGSTGVVYEAVQLSLKRPVALKVLRDELGSDPIAAQRFLRETRMLTCISHPSIVEILDHGETEDGARYLVMELLRGNTLDVLLAHQGAFSLTRVVHVMTQLCDALEAAHAQGIVHRDLKPANIVLLAGPDDRIKVVDFGLAKPSGDTWSDVTFTGALLGTPLYMAPEAARAEPLDARSDLYALGCILYELITGQPAFAGESSAMVLARQLADEPAPLPAHVPPTLVGLVGWLLAKSPADRPASVADVRDWLNR